MSKLGLTTTLTPPVSDRLQVTKEWREKPHFRHVLMYIYNQHWWGPTGKGDMTSVRQAQPLNLVIFSDGEQRNVEAGTFLRLPPRAVLCHSTIPLISQCLLHSKLGVLRTRWHLLYQNSIKCTSFYSSGFFWKTNCSTSSRTSALCCM